MEKFDVIIVGGGLAGLSAAYTLAQEGLETLVLERGDYSGAKNVTGGRMYVNPIRDLFPDLWKKAPFERFIAREEVSIMAEERSVTMQYDGNELAQEPYQSFSLLRGKFDKWFAREAERKGAMLVSKARVDDVIMEDGKVVGVRADGDELRADVVIACDGVLSFIAEKAGLRKPLASKNYAVGCKEIIEMDRQLLEDRFNLQGDEGMARLYMGDVTGGSFGGGFLYTNKESLSLGIVVGIDALLENEEAFKAPELLDRFKQRPEIASLIKGGQTAEYSAHVIPEGGVKAMGSLYGSGILVAGDAAGFSMNIGVTVRGMEYAMASGYYAAQAAMAAKARNDFSGASLAEYKKLLDKSFVMEDFNNFKESLDVLDHSRFFTFYPELAGSIMRDLYAVPAGAKDRIFPTIKKHMTVGEIFGIARDMWRLRKI